jgi:hypothetical protein
MAEVKDVSGTAFVVAEFRAEENRESSAADVETGWVTGIDDVTALAASLRLIVVENVKTAELYRRYWLDRPMTSPLFEFYSLCTLESSAR